MLAIFLALYLQAGYLDRLPLFCFMIGTLITAALTTYWAPHRQPWRSLTTAVIGLGCLVASFYALLLVRIKDPTPRELILQPLLLFIQPGCWPLFVGLGLAICGAGLRFHAGHIWQGHQPEEQ